MFQRAIARYGLYTFAWLFERLPPWFVRVSTAVLLTIAYPCIIRQRRIATESIDIAFGNTKSQVEKQAIVKQCFLNFGRGMTEMLYCLAHFDKVKEKISIQGQEHLDAALAKKNGVIAVTAHFGNFPLMMLYFALRGYKTSSIIRPARDQELSDYFERKRTAFGLKTIYAIPRRACVLQSLKELRDNGLLFIPIDQNFGSGGGVYVDFFGQKAATATGPAVFAMRTGAVILPMFIVRHSREKHKIIIEPAIAVEKGEGERAVITATMAKITALIERYIRRYPQEWAWMHRRWKSRPSKT